MSGSAVAATVQPPVHETTLSNGLKVLIQEVHTAPVVSFMVWYKVGSRNESAGITGISHLLEHMMFKGTPRYAKGEIARTLQRHGASFNAGTSLDYTCYYEVLAKDRLEIAMDAEALQHGERGREQRHDRDHRRIDEAHRAQGQVALRKVTNQRVHEARDD